MTILKIDSLNELKLPFPQADLLRSARAAYFKSISLFDFRPTSLSVRVDRQAQPPQIWLEERPYNGTLRPATPVFGMDQFPTHRDAPNHNVVLKLSAQQELIPLLDEGIQRYEEASLIKVDLTPIEPRDKRPWYEKLLFEEQATFVKPRQPSDN